MPAINKQPATLTSLTDISLSSHNEWRAKTLSRNDATTTPFIDGAILSIHAVHRFYSVSNTTMNPFAPAKAHDHSFPLRPVSSPPIARASWIARLSASWMPPATTHRQHLSIGTLPWQSAPTTCSDASLSATTLLHAPKEIGLLDVRQSLHRNHTSA
jgi:hypothetical protein